MPLLTIIPAIFAGISALTSVAGNKQASEQIVAQGGTIGHIVRNEQIEKPVERRTSQSGNISMSVDELINKSFEFLTGKGFSVSI